ncbi:MAG: GNAT family N-acetyltransferase [Bacteroidota bacterium]
MNENYVEKKYYFNFRTIPKTHIDKLHNAFQLSFANYHVNINTSLAALKDRMARIGIDLSISVAAYNEAKIIGFIIQAGDTLNGEKTAYNGGTGVIPLYRRKHISTELYTFAFPILKEKGFKQCILEVIQENEPAIKTYKRLGFCTTRKLLCYKTEKKINLPPAQISLTLHIIKNKLPDWKLYETFYDFIPTWQNSTASVLRNFDNETIIEAFHQAKVVGFVIFESLSGKISQLAVDRSYRRQGIGSQLLRTVASFSRVPRLSVLNVDENTSGMSNFLIRAGFKEVITQEEMIKLL